MATLTDLLDQLDPDDNVHKGAQFERICQWFLTHDPAYAHEIRQVWLWDDWPGRWGADAGIDLVAVDRQGNLWAIQAKAYAENTSITKHDVDTFLSESARSVFAFRLLIATTNRIGSTAKRTLEAQEKQAAVLLRGDLEAAQLDWPESPSSLRARPVVPKQPRPHQRSAIEAVVNGFDSGDDRGQLIMACGTGKTLTALFVSEELAADRTLVLVPSLALLAQTLREWTANSTLGFDFLPVCSDRTVADSDSAASSTSDLGLPVTTDPEDIAAFLRGPGRRVVFATYQSSPQISSAFGLGDVPAFDLVIADEAHRCTGRISPDFGVILRPGLIETRRRLFMTATPRHFTGQTLSEAQEADFEIASMDDRETFGPVFHRLGFAEAIDNELLTDYRVVVIGADDNTYREWADQGRVVTTDGATVSNARILAGQVGLAKAMHRYNLRRTISFHSRVRGAKEFAAGLPAVIDWMPPDQRPSGRLWAGHVSGEMPTGQRHVLLQQLGGLHDCDRALLTNSRCLTEGVDVPALDGVAFIDPRRSVVDIVQAVGRAIRLAADKTIGTIVIPVFVDTDKNPATALDDSSFKPVWDVIKALRSHDDRLGEALDELRYQLGKQGDGGCGRIPDKIVLDLPVTVSHEFADAFDVRLVEQTTTSWEFWLGLLKQFIEQEGHALVPATHRINGHALGSWVAIQRYRQARGWLDTVRKHRLDRVPGWTWDALTSQWEEGFARLVAYVEEHGHAMVPQSWVIDGYRLGTWVTIQRTNHAEGRGLPDREERLQALPGWSWDPRTDQWEQGFRYLIAYVEEHGHPLVPKPYMVGDYRLGSWVGTQRSRYAKGALAEARVQRLQAIPGWSWDPDSDQWEKYFAMLSAYVEEHENARIPRNFTVDGHLLGSWVSNQRQSLKNGKLAADRAERLQALPGWNPGDPWEEWFLLLVAYVETHGHTRLPNKYTIGDHRLGNWVAKQRDKYAAATLAADKIERLETLAGWTWDPFADQWEEGFRFLASYVRERGHARVPGPYTVDAYPLGQWVGVQRSGFAKQRLPQARIERLQALPGWSWDLATDQWEDGFIHLTDFVQQNGHARVPQSYVNHNGFSLGSWVGTQRSKFARKTLRPEWAERLEALPGWSWDPIADQWEEGFTHLADFVQQTGHARVPGLYVDPTGFRLGQWCKVQRRARANGTISADRLSRLNALPGWSWDPIADQWEEGFTHLTGFVQQTGHACVPDAFTSPDDFRLGQWVGVQRRTHADGTLSADRLSRLEALPGWSWDPIADQWEEGFTHLTDFVQQTGHARVPGPYVDPTGFSLGIWAGTQRNRYAKGRITEEQEKRLDTLPGWSWDTLTDQWEDGFARLTAFIEQYGHSRVPQKYLDQAGYRLGGWVATQRQRYAKGSLAPARANRLEKASPDWTWDPYHDKWEEGYAHLVAYVERHGNARVPKAHTVDDYPLGEWCKRQRDARSKSNLAADRFERLVALLGWSWDLDDNKWEEGFAHLVAYATQHGHTRIHREYEADGYRLGNWASNQRAARSRGILSSERAIRLEAVPNWSWVVLDERWEQGFARLLAYVEQHGHTLVPQKHIDQTGFNLGTWVSTQRMRHSKGILTADRTAQLAAVAGWSWDPTADQWEKGFERLLVYVEQEDHALVPQKHIDETGFRLGVWVLTQRRRMVKGAILNEQAKRLEDLPRWTWDAR
ncbi:Helicase associated domain protein [Nocardia sp. NPDC003183]